MNYILPNSDRIQRDLNWLSFSSDIISVCELAEKYDLNLNSGRELLQGTLSEETEIISTNRLGVYFEQLCAHQLQQNSDVSIVAANQQIFHDKQTIGEFDLIIEQSQKTIHFEFAVKFYLQVGKGEQLSDWVGPNLKDRFDNKYQRLAEHQLQLSQQHHVQEWLITKNIPIDQVGLITRGRLFYPYSEFMNDNFIFPADVDKAHLKGFWMSEADFINGHDFSDYQCVELPRSHWLSEVTATEFESLIAFDCNSLTKVTAVLLWHDHQEYMRGFIVPNEWLEKAQQRISTVS